MSPHRRTLRRATLTDVAVRAGVSTTTASYILNGRSQQMRISAETQGRVREAASHLGYRPNRSARSLRTATTATIGVISDFVASGHYASQMLSGASAAARESDHLLVIGETEGDPAVEARLIEEMIDRQVDGILYLSLVTRKVTVSSILLQHRVVLVNCLDPRLDLPSVVPDELQAGRTAAGLLIEAGVSEGLYVVGEDPTPQALAGPLRLEGVHYGLREAGFSLTGVVPCPWDVVAARDTVGAWLAEGARPGGLVCLNDRVAMGVYQALAEHGLRIPDDVSLVSFDGSDLAGWLQPRLTSVVVPYAEMGATAVHRLLEPEGAARDLAAVTAVPMSVEWGRSLRHRRSSLSGLL
ncbi:MAG: LacI family transcriptional regulator [Nocardioidaceae bacterium]|nr:LacI family transcriptional regulator [Nocardioidaceae bacterium]